MSDCWYEIENAADVDSPALVVYPARIAENIRRMIAIACGPERLRPHVKTHKMSAVVRLELAAGISRFKCATLAEAEMTARAGASDVLIAYQLVGPKIDKLVQLCGEFPDVRFSTIVDDAQVARQLSAAFQLAAGSLDVLLDLDLGMERTGIKPRPEAAELYRLLANLPNLRPAGLHAYDGHIHATNPAVRRVECEAAFAPVERLRAELMAEGLSVPQLVAGGTPTLPIHAEHADRQCSPGTCLLWDAGYGASFPDLDFVPAAVVLTRVVSKPAANRLCLDLGHKRVAAENPAPRVVWPDLPDAPAVLHNEEHLVLETPLAARFTIGDVLYGIPWHICPTCALYPEAVVVTDGRASQTWPVDG